MILKSKYGHTNDRTSGCRVNQHFLPCPSRVIFPATQKIMKFYTDTQTAQIVPTWWDRLLTKPHNPSIKPT